MTDAFIVAPASFTSDEPTEEGCAFTVFALLDETGWPGARQLAQVVNNVYEEAAKFPESPPKDLMARVLCEAGKDKTNTRPVAVAIALDKVITHDASQNGPKPLDHLNHNESMDLLGKLHEMSKSLKPVKQETPVEQTTTDYVIPFWRRGRRHHPAFPYL